MSEPKEPSLWLPEQDRIKIALLGKLIEECGELTSAAARCTIQGLDESDPVTCKKNHAWLSEELADVLALIQLVENVLGVSISTKRIEDKYAMKLKWVRMIRDWQMGRKSAS